jgi:hypothetical protein
LFVNVPILFSVLVIQKRKPRIFLYLKDFGKLPLTNSLIYFFYNLKKSPIKILKQAKSLDAKVRAS